MGTPIFLVAFKILGAIRAWQWGFAGTLCRVFIEDLSSAALIPHPEYLWGNRKQKLCLDSNLGNKKWRKFLLWLQGEDIRNLFRQENSTTQSFCKARAGKKSTVGILNRKCTFLLPKPLREKPTSHMLHKTRHGGPEASSGSCPELSFSQEGLCCLRAMSSTQEAEVSQEHTRRLTSTSGDLDEFFSALANPTSSTSSEYLACTKECFSS